MKQTSKRFTSMIFALVCLAASLMIFFDLIQPTYGDLQTKKGTEESSQTLLTNEQQLVTQIQSLLTKYQGENQAQANLLLAMPSGPDVAGALAQVYGISAVSNVSVKSVVVSPPSIQLPPPPQPDANGNVSLSLSQITKPKGTVGVQISGTGSYENVKVFLSALETNIRLFDVTSFSLQGAPSSLGANARGLASTPDLFTFGISAVTYYELP